MNDKAQRITMATQSLSDAVPPGIGLMPTWDKVGNIIRRLIRTDELSAFEYVEVEMARALSAYQVLQAVQKDLPDDLCEITCAIIATEMAKQGLGSNNVKGKKTVQ